MARKAKGVPSLRLFSARWKWTRPTVFHRGLLSLRYASTVPSKAAIWRWTSTSIETQAAERTSTERYSAPVIGGAAAASASSSGKGVRTAIWVRSASISGMLQRWVKYALPISRPKASEGGSSAESSAVPRRMRPSAGEAVKAAVTRCAVAAGRRS